MVIPRRSVTMMPHSIFIREHEDDNLRPPELIAYDIESVSLANRLVRSIAKSGRSNGFDCRTGRRWFRLKDTIFDIYRMKIGS